MNPAPAETRRLSYSSAGVLQGCQRRYWHKVHETPADPDYDDDRKALRIGKGFHRAMELCGHDRAKFSPAVLNRAMADEQVDNPEEQGLILAMGMMYLDLHSRSKLEAVACETEIGDKHIIGYVDVVLKDADGYWYIGDLKTAGKLSGDLMSRLNHDPQLNLYGFYYPEIAAKYGLDPNKFSGARYRVTTKGMTKMKDGETKEAYAKRLVTPGRDGKSIVEAYDAGIPANPRIMAATRQRMERLYDQHVEIIETKKPNNVLQNFGHCFHYFSPCQYWSQCHGKTYTEAAQCVKLIARKNLTVTTPGDSLPEEIDIIDLM